MNTKRIEFPTHKDERGSLTIAEHLPFDIERVFYIYGVHPDARRGGHAHKTCHQALVVIRGKCRILVNGKQAILNKPDVGLYIPPGHFVEMEHFTPGAVLLVLASEVYDEDDYIYPGEVHGD